METATGGRRRTELLRDAGVALAVLLGTYALGTLGFPPGYFLVAAADAFQAAWPGAAPTFDIALAVVCVALAAIAAVVASLARAYRDAPTERWWAGGVGGALGALGALAVGFAVAFLLGANVGPTFVAAVTAAALLAAGVAVLRR